MPVKDFNDKWGRWCITRRTRREDYQVPFERDLAQAVKQHTHVLGVSPGGTGKTTTFSHIAVKAAAKGRSVIILTHRLSIFDQNLIGSCGIALNAETDKSITIQLGKVYVIMAQTIKFRPEWIEQFNTLPEKVLIIIDEAHDGGFCTILDKLTNRLTIGFTATPNYKDAKHLPLYYNALVETKPISWFIENPKQQYLASYTHIEKSQKDVDSYLTKLNGEFTNQSQNKYFSSRAIYGGLIEDIPKYKYTKCMIFCANIENAELIYSQVCAAGYLATIGHSKRKDEAQQIAKFKDLTSGYDIMVSVSAYTTGFDFPEVDQLMLYRAFGTLSLYLQTLYRGSRFIKGIKEHFRVVDYGNNKRHGLYFFDRPWQKMWRPESLKLDLKGQGVEPIKECSNCQALIGLMARICPYCGSEQPISEDEKKQGQLIDITESFNNMKGMKIGDLSARQLSIYAKLMNKGQFCIRIAKAKRQSEIKEHLEKPPQTPINYLKDFAHYMDYNPAWVYQQEKLIKEQNEQINFANIIIK